MAKKLTLKEIYANIKEGYDIEVQLAPYKDGGTENRKVERSSGTILDWLINKKKFSPEMAGAGLISTLMEMKQGLSFPGDGTYGSKGDEMVHYIAQKCDRFNKKQLQFEMFKTIAGAKIEVMEEVVFEMTRKMLPAPLVWLSPGAWRWLKKRKKRKVNVTS